MIMLCLLPDNNKMSMLCIDRNERKGKKENDIFITLHLQKDFSIKVIHTNLFSSVS
jgi:hypothetical protein